MLYILDLFGTAVFAITGALMGIHKKLDLFGVIVVGFVTAVGGGTLRDLMLGRTPVFWLKDINYLIVILIGASLTFILGHRLNKIHVFLSVSDAVGLAVFTIIGINKGISSEMSWILCIMMGVTTAVAGGIIRDILCQEIPMVLSREIYATACIIGGCVFFALKKLGVPEVPVTVVSIVLIIVIRLISIKMNLSLPKRIHRHRE